MRMIARYWQRIFISVLAWFGAEAQAQAVPASIPTIEILNAYLNFLVQADNKAFAVSRDGFFGEAWAYGSERDAINAAKSFCMEGSPGLPCLVIDVNGRSSGDQIDSEVLRQRLKNGVRKSLALTAVKPGSHRNCRVGTSCNRLSKLFEILWL